MYRLYNPNSGEHFYTASSYERDQTVKAGWNYEGIGWYAPAKPNSTPVYRLYNSYAGDHHYTRSKLEADTLKKLGWKDEGIGWHSYEEADAIYPLRQYNPNAVAGSHNYTASKVENDHLVRVGWKAEGTAWGSAPAPVNRRWVEPTYKTVTRTVMKSVPYQETVTKYRTETYQEKVVDVPASTKNVAYTVGCVLKPDGSTFCSENAQEVAAMKKELTFKYNQPIRSYSDTRYRTETVPEQSHMETRTRQVPYTETVTKYRDEPQTVTERVVDVPGHWE